MATSIIVTVPRGTQHNFVIVYIMEGRSANCCILASFVQYPFPGAQPHTQTKPRLIIKLSATSYNGALVNLVSKVLGDGVPMRETLKLSLAEKARFPGACQARQH